MTHLESNQRPSDLWHSTLTTVPPRSPHQRHGRFPKCWYFCKATRVCPFSSTFFVLSTLWSGSVKCAEWRTDSAKRIIQKHARGRLIVQQYSLPRTSVKCTLKLCMSFVKLYEMYSKGIYASITLLVEKKMKFKNYDMPFQSRLFSVYYA